MYIMRLSASLLVVLTASSNGYTLSLDCAPDNGTMTTPTFGTTGALFTVCAQTTINSPPSPIYNVLFDFPRYPAWNTFVYLVDLPSNVSSGKDVYVGMLMTLHSSGLFPGVNSTSGERITFLEPDAVPPFAAWRYDEGDLVGLVMNAEHVTVLDDLGNGTTRYISWETYYGPGAVATLALRANFQTGWEMEARDLKARVEGLWLAPA
jgi:hypothetical protein